MTRKTSKKSAVRSRAMRVFEADQHREVAKEDRLAAEEDKEERQRAKGLRKRRR